MIVKGGLFRKMDNEIIGEFPNRVRMLRNERGLSMEMLAYDLNVKYGLRINKGTISRWESGQADPSISYVVYIADYFNVNLDYMIGLTDVRLPVRLLAYAKAIKEVASDEHRKERTKRLQNPGDQERTDLLADGGSSSHEGGGEGAAGRTPKG